MKILQLFWLIPIIFFSCQTTREWTAADIKPVKSFGKDCGQFLAANRNFPQRARISIFERNNNIYLSAGDINYYRSLFQKKYDGIAVETVYKESYSCEQPVVNRQPGYFFREPWLILFKENLDTLKNLSLNPNKMLLKIGELPADFDRVTMENNLITIERKYHCNYQNFINIENQRWELLEMGIFKDSMRVKTNGDVYSLNEKSLEFTISYEKNDATIKEADLKPIYDSLNFTDYDITSVNIVAFASIEGDKELNEHLVKQRSRNVVRALQKYQKPEIIYQIDALENWDQFYSEIKRTQFKDLADLDKDAIKKIFSGNEENLKKFEPLLARHRKAIVKIILTRKRKIESLSNQQLITAFNESVKSENINKMKSLLDYVLERFKDSENPRAFIDQLEIPPARFNGPLLNNINGFMLRQGMSSDEESLLVFEELYRMFPLNEEILYNLIAIKLLNIKKIVDKSALKQVRVLLDQLQVSKIPPKLKYRPWINYYILSNEYYHQTNDFNSSRQMMKNILSIYKNILTYDDRLRIAKYFGNYYQYDQAEQIMRPVIENDDIPDELLFYYLNVTIAYDKYYKEDYYQELVERARKIDRVGFCNFFQSSNAGGISFQLLQYKKLKDIYCKICQ